ncbi:hypothetical protein [Roseateles sp.]|uniref:hypothetical protein n=1 Tax=Roseateles sp. TaxID=1971397 RepID=UPI0039EA42C1
MQFVVALVLFAIFWAVSPRIFKWLFKLNFVLSVGGFILLRIVAFFFGATRGGRNAGMFEDEALVIGLSFFGMAAIVVLGIVSGALMAWFRSRGSRA